MPAIGFSLRYQADWGVAENSLQFFSPASARGPSEIKESIQLVFAGFAGFHGALGTENLASTSKSHVQSEFQDALLTHSAPQTVCGQDGRKFTYSGKKEGREVTIVQVCFMTKERPVIPPPRPGPIPGGPSRTFVTLTYWGETSEFSRHSGLFDAVVRSLKTTR